MLKKALMLVSGNAFGSALLLLRNLIVARLISPEDYGIAATFAISMSLVEMLSYLGLNQMIVVDKDGDDEHMQNALQGFQLLRGIFSSTVLFLIAVPYARFLDIEHVAWAYQVIALIPLISGLQHYDMHRLKRHLKFGPSVIAQAVPPLVSVLALWPLALIFDDYRIMLVALLVQAVALVALSHLTAERRYRLQFDIAIMRSATKFGWPLLLNGILLFGVFNGERLIVGRELGMGQLAIFSMAMTLTLTPTLVLAGACQSLFLPQLSGALDKPGSFRWLGVASIEAGLAIGLLLILGVVLLGGPLVHLLLGDKYLPILNILVPIAVVQAIRVMKSGSSTVALAKKMSGNSAVSNLFRVISLPVSWVALIQTGEVMMVIYIAMAAEVLGYLVSVYLVVKRTELTLSPLIVPSVVAALTCIAALVSDWNYPPEPHLGPHLQHGSMWLVVACGLTSLALMSNLRGYLIRTLLRRER
ncbi:oligosaccharide flippase family protein [Defluviimonas sp. WL0050]|uniref:Oligosaccharide flippase family protein n=1 Tax=Albidovulum litorale TaxID=2984134 RepID=A0ABT2ZRX8_9RHOB|nr:oligosaccharide flippase family protein [Defluviimonas sp. WL0050]MCV2873764.1 oligosaccharide flippase family protein [Defluviimonas sp. WL0050]